MSLKPIVWGDGPEILAVGTGLIAAMKLVLQCAGLNLMEMDVIKSNQAFAAHSRGVCCGLDLDPAGTNPNGGAIALGHPLDPVARSSW